MRYFILLIALFALFSCKTEKEDPACTALKNVVPMASYFIAPIAECNPQMLSAMIIADAGAFLCKNEVATVTALSSGMLVKTRSADPVVLNILRTVCKSMVSTMIGFGKVKLISQAGCSGEKIDELLNGNPADMCLKINF